MDEPQTEIVQLSPEIAMTIEYKVTIGELMVITLLSALILVILAKWFYKLIFRK